MRGMARDMTTGRQSGFGYSYLGLLLVLAVVSFSLSVGAGALTNRLRRDKEEDLLYAGDQIRRAIERYHQLNASGQYPYPRDLESLLRDPFAPGVKRHLRRVFPDPMTQGKEWVLIRGERNAIIGVHSSSTREPLKTSGFPKDYASFSTAKTYADWRFIAAGAIPAVQQKPSTDRFPDMGAPVQQPSSTDRAPIPTASVLGQGKPAAAAPDDPTGSVPRAALPERQTSENPTAAAAAAEIAVPVDATRGAALDSSKPASTIVPQNSSTAASPTGGGSSGAPPAAPDSSGTQPSKPAPTAVPAPAPTPASGEGPAPFVIRSFGQ